MDEITSQQVKGFKNDGFVVLRGFFDSTQVQELTSHLDGFVDRRVTELPHHHVFYELPGVKDSLKQIQHLDQHDATFHCLLHEGRLKRLSELLLEDQTIGRNLQYFNKPPLIGKATPPHQDGFYFMLDPPKALTMWIAVDRADENNGCVRYLPGSHRLGLRTHQRTSTLGFSQGIPDYPSPAERDHEITMTAEPGDLLVHDALTIHRAERNQSVASNRRSLGFIYYAKSAKEDEDAKRSYQQELKREMDKAVGA